MKLPEALSNKLQNRTSENALRVLKPQTLLIDFATNDYLGFAKNTEIFNKAHQLLVDKNCLINGATGSRLLSGNHSFFDETESYIAQFHQSEAALIFNSGYDANVGFFSCVPQRNDIILYDDLCHASIRDGIQMSLAKAYKFKHNDLEDLEKRLRQAQSDNYNSEVYIVTESVFSMDGDLPDMSNLIKLAEKYNALVIIDEAHALGVVGKNGEGLVQSLQLQVKVFARIITFGKALGCHGAVILGSDQLKSYLINFCRSFIYTTALSPHAIATVFIAYQQLAKSQNLVKKLQENAHYFDSFLSQHAITEVTSSIKSVIISGNQNVKKAALLLHENGFDVKPILSPTVSAGQERLRFCLHSYNSQEEISAVCQLLTTFV